MMNIMRTFFNFILSAFSIRSQTRIRLQAEAQWLCEYMKILAIDKPCVKEKIDRATKLLDKAKELLMDDHGGDDLEPEQFAGRLTALRLILEARSYEMDLISDECLPIRASELHRDIKGRPESWRRDNILELLEEACDEKGNYRRALLREIVQRCNEYEANQYVRKAIIRSHLRIIMVCLLICTSLLIIVLAAALSLDVSTIDTIEDSELVKWGDIWIPLASALAGAIGACLSSLLTMTSDTYNPDIYMSRLVTWARPLTGFAAGLVAYLFVIAGIIPVRGGAIVVIAVAVTFGFSERLFLGTMAKVDAYRQADTSQQPF